MRFRSIVSHNVGFFFEENQFERFKNQELDLKMACSLNSNKSINYFNVSQRDIAKGPEARPRNNIENGDEFGHATKPPMQGTGTSRLEQARVVHSKRNRPGRQKD